MNCQTFWVLVLKIYSGSSLAVFLSAITSLMCACNSNLSTLVYQLNQVGCFLAAGRRNPGSDSFRLIAHIVKGRVQVWLIQLFSNVIKDWAVLSLSSAGFVLRLITRWLQLIQASHLVMAASENERTSIFLFFSLRHRNLSSKPRHEIFIPIILARIGLYAYAWTSYWAVISW